MRYGLALLPSAEGMQQIIDFQHARKEFPPPLLGMHNNLPHVTLVQSYFDEETITVDYLKLIATHLGAPLSALAVDLSYSAGGWWFVNFEASADFTRTQNIAFAFLADRILTGEIDTEKDYSHLEDIQRFNYLKYGYRYFGAAFHPHFTMGHNPETLEIPADIINEFNAAFTGNPFLFDRLAWYELGASGACASIICEVPLEATF